MVEMWTETGQVPSEQTTQGQGDERRQQEVGDSVEVERREGHHGDGQGEGEAGSHMKEFTGRDEEDVKAEFPGDYSDYTSRSLCWWWCVLTCCWVLKCCS